MSLKIVKDCDFKKRLILVKGLDKYAKEQKDLPCVKSFDFYLQDEDRILGGIAGIALYGALHIQLLWIAKKLRNKKLGTKLIKEAEKWAKKQKCKMILVETFDFNPVDFYKKMGFEIEFERKGFLKNSTFYYLRKNI